MSGVAVLTITFVMICNSLYRGRSGGSGEIDCSLGSNHTMCKYPGPAPGCAPGQLTSGERDDIISVHNSLRAKVASGKESRSKTGGPQPTASNMLQMKYDDDLAKVAQRWAEQCITRHDVNHNDKRYSSVGQNYAESGDSDPSFTFPLKGMITDWYNEVAVFDPAVVPSFRSTLEKTGHYTQVVWHGSELVGCGYAVDHVKYQSFDMKQFHLVCNYGPGGNVLGQEIYKIGAACTGCPSDHSTCSDNLCS